MKIGEAARILGTTPGQLRKWEATGELLPARKTNGGTRYYAMADLMGLSIFTNFDHLNREMFTVFDRDLLLFYDSVIH